MICPWLAASTVGDNDDAGSEHDEALKVRSTWAAD
jgi:hypothetical protein